jgi:hypothetical protein
MQNGWCCNSCSAWQLQVFWLLVLLTAVFVLVKFCWLVHLVLGRPVATLLP